MLRRTAVLALLGATLNAQQFVAELAPGEADSDPRPLIEQSGLLWST